MTTSVIVEAVTTGTATEMATNTQLHNNHVGLEAIDSFLAVQLCQSLDSQCGVLQHLIMALSKALRNGHSCLPLADIAGQTYWSSAAGETRTGIAAAPGIEASPGIETSPGYTFASFELLMESVQRYPITADHGAPLVLENARLYLRRYWQYEQQVAQHLLQRMQVHPLTEQQQTTADALLLKLFLASSEPQVDWQAQAVKEALVRQVSVISGGPGTGKTYTVARLLVALQAVNEQPLTIAMAAPTG